MSVRGYEEHPFVPGHEQEGSETRQGSPAPSDLLHLLVDLFRRLRLRPAALLFLSC